jgi:hypothetical protein
MEQNTDKFNKFLTTWSGRDLLERHSLDEYGQWNVHGEDPNCDLGGSHSCPYLGLLEGKLRDVIAEAVEMDRFWQWGGGGEIKKIVPVTARPVGPPGQILDTALFALVEQKTYEGKIDWKHCHGPECSGFSGCQDSKRLTGEVPEGTLLLSLRWDEGVDTLALELNGDTVAIGSGEFITALRKRILAQPVEDTVAKASKILESL